MTKLEKAEAAMKQSLAHYTACDRATYAALRRLVATPKGRAFLTLRKSTRKAKSSLIAARAKELQAKAEEKHPERVFPWTRFKASDSPFSTGK